MKELNSVRAGYLLTALVVLTQSSVYAQGAIDAPEFPSPFNQLRLPQIFNNPIVPTDMAGLGGGLGFAKGQRNQLLGPEARVALADLSAIKADDRYRFAGRWLPLSRSALASVHGEISIGAQNALTKTKNGEEDILETEDATATGAVHIMPTVGAEFKLIRNVELLLKSGAMLVKTTGDSIIVSAFVGDDNRKVMTRMGGNSLALVSLFDNKISVFNFLNDETIGCSMYFPSKDGQSFELSVPQGRLAEVYPSLPQPGLDNINNLRAGGRQSLQQVLADGRAVRLTQFDYPRTMKILAMVRALPKDDFEQMIKVAAATSVALRTR